VRVLSGRGSSFRSRLRRQRGLASTAAPRWRRRLGSARALLQRSASRSRPRAGVIGREDDHAVTATDLLLHGCCCCGLREAGAGWGKATTSTSLLFFCFSWRARVRACVSMRRSGRAREVGGVDLQARVVGGRGVGWVVVCVEEGGGRGGGGGTRGEEVLVASPLPPPFLLLLSPPKEGARVPRAQHTHNTMTDRMKARARSRHANNP
jgi:hypothetical protein